MARQTALILACIVALAGVESCGAPPEPVTVLVTPGRPDVRVAVVRADSVLAVLRVTSPSGIGSATVDIRSGPAPERVVVQLALRGLEELRFSYGSTTVIGAISSGPGHQTRETLRSAGHTQELSVVPGSPYWMDLRIVPEGGVPATIPLQAGYFEALAPADFYASGAGSFTITWVDFYR